MINEIVIPMEKLCQGNICDLSLLVDDNSDVLITGKVIDPDGNPVPNAGIEIIQVTKVNCIRKTIGCIFSDESGDYAFTLKIEPKYSYLFKLYTKI